MNQVTDVKHKVLVTDRLIEDDEHARLECERAILEPLGVTLVNNFSSAEEDIVSAGKGAVGLLVTYQKITRHVMESLPELKVIVKCGIGYDNINTHAAAELGIYTANVPDYGDEEVASHALTLMLDAVRATSFTSGELKSGRWVTNLPSLGLRRPSELAVGTVGMGRIARRLHQYVHPLTSRLKFYDPFVTSRVGAQRCDSLAELFQSCDVVSLHLPLNVDTFELVSDELLNQAKPGLVLVNTSRAGLVSRGALLRALESGRVGHYGTDVAWEEPVDTELPDNRNLLANPRVVITPHIAWHSADSEQDLRRKAAMEIARVINGEAPLHVVR